MTLTLNTLLDSEVGKPVIKKKTIAKLVQITEYLDPCDLSFPDNFFFMSFERFLVR